MFKMQFRALLKKFSPRKTIQDTNIFAKLLKKNADTFAARRFQ